MQSFPGVNINDDVTSLNSMIIFCDACFIVSTKELVSWLSLKIILFGYISSPGLMIIILGFAVILNYGNFFSLSKAINSIV